MENKLYNLDLYHNQVPVSFAIKRLETIDEAQNGIFDKPHRHNYYSVIWSFNAKGKHIIDFREHHILPQSLFFVSPGQVHQLITEANPTGLVILFTCEFLQRNSIREDFISDLKLFRESDDSPPMEIHEAMQKRLQHFAQGMVDAFESETDFRLEKIGSYLKLFLIECNGHCSLKPESNTQNAEVKKSIVQQFKILVEKHFREWHQVQEYAENMNVSPNYLNEVIKMAIGQSAKEYIQTRLILEAKRMSIFTRLSSKEIGFDLGFEDPSHFSKFFKSNTGKSVMEFKEKLVI